MEDDISIGELKRMIENLNGVVSEGFKGVHCRQDTTNGKVLRHEEWLLQNREFISDMKSERKANITRVMDLIWKVASILALAGVSYIGAKNFL